MKKRRLRKWARNTIKGVRAYLRRMKARRRRLPILGYIVSGKGGSAEGEESSSGVLYHYSSFVTVYPNREAATRAIRRTLDYAQEKGYLDKPDSAWHGPYYAKRLLAPKVAR